MTTNNNLITYGAKLKSSQLQKTLEHIFSMNNKAAEDGQRGTPVCIWGTHGIGKTQIVQDFAHKNKWHFAYCAPAQFEEMGDLHGMPEIVDPETNIIGDEFTIFRPPEWVPRLPGPGILLLDDINRADDRILRGLMQLLQNFSMFSWQLPTKWQIVATANPEGGDYSLTPMDDAMITRMLHTTLVFDSKDWAAWAIKAKVDPRGIAFVLTYPNIVTGVRTTPRTLTQFFEQIKYIPDLKTDIELVKILALSALDEITTAAFLGFINDDLEKIIEPETILEAKSFDDVHKRIKELSAGKNGIRIDRLSAICTRLYLHITNESYNPKQNHAENLTEFILMKELPGDLRMSLCLDLTKNASDAVKEMLRDKRVAKIILDGM